MNSKLNQFLLWLIAGLALLFTGNLLIKIPQVADTQTASGTLQPNATIQPFSTLPAGRQGTAINSVLVTRVIDGDTIEIEGGTRVRYIGIDTPEVGQCLADAATAENSQFAEGKNVKLETDIEKYDKYGRLLAYVFTNDTFVNEKLVADGLATVTTYPPDVKYVDRYLSAQKEAKLEKRGLWSADPCHSNSLTPPSSTASDCLIKGNISSSGDKIYHVPGQRYYEKTKIEENKGERWFCSESEAQNAGWRKSRI